MKKLIWILPTFLLCSCWQEYIVVMVAEPTPILEILLGVAMLPFLAIPIIIIVLVFAAWFGVFGAIYGAIFGEEENSDSTGCSTCGCVVVYIVGTVFLIAVLISLFG